MKKVLFVIGSFQLGGAETVMVDLINNIYQKFDITVLALEKRGPLLEILNSNVKVRYLTKGKEYCKNKYEIIYNKMKLSLMYRFLGKNKTYIKFIYKRVLKDTYDVEVPFLVGLPTEIVRRSPNQNSKKITWIHADVKKEDVKTYQKYLNIYKYYDKLIGVSEKSIKTFENTFPESKGKIQLIHNYIDINKIILKSNQKIQFEFPKDKLNILSLGRLVDDKGFDRIINIAKKFEDKINFNIIGGGPLEDTLVRLIEEKKITNVKLLGFQTNPYPYIKQADAFLLSSRSEAYPTVVLEAMILRKSIIATKVPGSEEILKDYENKILIENEDNSIEKGITKWLKNKNINVETENVTFEKNNKKNLEKVINLLNE